MSTLAEGHILLYSDSTTRPSNPTTTKTNNAVAVTILYFEIESVFIFIAKNFAHFVVFRLRICKIIKRHITRVRINIYILCLYKFSLLRI